MLFNTLRDWRSERARKEGVPPYLIFNNRTLLEILQKLPDSPTALGHVRGIGPGKIATNGAASSQARNRPGERRD